MGESSIEAQVYAARPKPARAAAPRAGIEKEVMPKRQRRIFRFKIEQV
jgi:hypothetical protein